MENKKIKAVILAAGRGSRMGELTKDKPKGLISFREKSLIEWQIEAIRGSGILDIAIVAGYMAEKINFPNTEKFYNKRWNETNMVQSLCRASDWFKNSDIIISYSDIFYHTDSVSAIKDAPGDIVITHDPNWLKLWEKRFDNPLDDAETFRVDQDNILLEIGNKADSIEEIEGQYMGLLKFSKQGWKSIISVLEHLNPEERDRLDMTALLSLAIKKGKKILTTPVRSFWCEIDSEKDLKIFSKK